MYQKLFMLLNEGYEVTFRPVKKGNVHLTVQEAKNGTVKGVEVTLTTMEWAFSGDGIADRLDEALKRLRNK